MNSLRRVVPTFLFGRSANTKFTRRQNATSSAEPSETKEDVERMQGNLEKTINQVILLGRVGNEPQKRGTELHPAVIFSLATHSNFKFESGEQAQKTEWHRVVVFKPGLRDLVFTYLRKGQRVYITGKLNYGSINDGFVSKPTTSVVADDIIFFYSDQT